MIPPLHDDLDFNCPLSLPHADRLIRALEPRPGDHIVDLGCGWAELLLRALAASPDTTGHGIDLDAEAITHARTTASTRGLSSRVTLDAADASTYEGSADILIITGATHIWPDTTTAIATARTLLTPGGRLLLGEGIWRVDPPADRLAVMPMTREEYLPMADLVDLTITHGFRPRHISEATLSEWDDFQSRHAIGRERWLAANPNSPDADEVRAKADTHRNQWLRGWREVLGMAYLVLTPDPRH